VRETVEFRVYKEYAHLLFHSDEGKDLGSVQVVYVERDDPRFEKIGLLNKEIDKKDGASFFSYHHITRKYSKHEIDSAELFQVIAKQTFVTTGEECGTQYDETAACEICGANRKLIGPLKLRRSKTPKKDIARSIGGETIVSQKFADTARKRNLKGLLLTPVLFATDGPDYYRLSAETEIDLSDKTVAGVNPFDFSEGSEGSEHTIPGGYRVKFEKEVYKCPNGCCIGLNLLSELYVVGHPLINDNDFFMSRQKIGVRRGYLTPEPYYVCSPDFRRMVIEEKLTGFDFEIVRVE
jgi:hypothetical protein